MTVYDFKVKKRKGEVLDLSDYRGKVLLIVNTATGCGFTPQYAGLEELYKKYNGKGFEILDFPCNQFGNQAPGSDDEIHEFCSLRYKTTFDQLAKIDVNGDDEEPLYKYLKSEMPDEEIKGLKAKLAMGAVKKMSTTTKQDADIKWNFTKFLVDKNGLPVKRFNPTVTPEKLDKEIAALL